MSQTVGIKLEPEMKARLEALGKARDRSPHWLMKKAIADYVEREETYYRELEEDERRWERYLLTGEHVTLQQLDQWITQLPEA